MTEDVPIADKALRDYEECHSVPDVIPIKGDRRTRGSNFILPAVSPKLPKVPVNAIPRTAAVEIPYVLYNKSSSSA